MTPPFSIGSHVEITGPDSRGDRRRLGEKFKITEHWSGREEEYSTSGHYWYPASSLRLVEELKIGDLVKIVGPDWADVIRSHDPETAYPIHTKTEAGNFQIIDIGIFPATSLRKLTPEEIQQHQTAQMLPKPAELQELRRRIHDLEMSLDGFTNGPEPEYVPGISHVKDPIRKRLSTIESRLNSLVPSHAELLGDVGALAERMGAIEKHQQEQHERIDRFMQDYREHKDFDFDMHDRIKVLEGERPEVCDRQPNAGSIRVSIQRGNDPARIFFDTCAFDCQIWAKKVLDSMKEA